MKEVLLNKTENSPYTWIDIVDPSAAELDEVAHQFGLHRYMVQDCLEAGHLPKFEKLDKYSFIIVRMYSPKTDQNPHTIQDLTSKVAIFYGVDFVITIHRKQQDFLKMVYDKHCTMQRQIPVNELVTRILWYALHTFEAPSTVLERDIDDYEERIFLKDTIPGLQEKLYFIKHKARVSKKVLVLGNDVIHHAYVDDMNNPMVQDLKELQVKLITVYDEIHDDTNNLLNVYLSLSAQKTNEVMRILTVFSVFFMPLTFIVGIYGMNFTHMPELQSEYGYPIVMIVMVVVSVLIYFWFKRKKWL